MSGYARYISVLVLCVLARPSLAQPDPASQAPPEPATVMTSAADTERLPLGAPRPSPAIRNSGSSRNTGEGPSLGILRTGGSLALVLLLAVGAAVVVKRFARARGGLAAAFGPGGPAPAGVLEILGRYPIMRGQTLVLLRAHNRVLLLSHSSSSRLGRVGGGAMSTLCEFADPEEVGAIITGMRDAEGESIAARFRSLLTGFDHRSGAAAADESAPSAAPGRRCGGVNDEGDRAELWDDRHAVRPSPGVSQLPPLHLVGQPAPQPPAPADAVTSLQRRLDAMRGAGATA